MTLALAPPLFFDAGVDDPALIIVPHVTGMIHQETIEHILVSGRTAKFPLIDKSDPYAYGKLFARYWNAGPDLIIVEQDMVPPYGFCHEFQVCDQPFCTHRYDCHGPEMAYGLGCARFSAQFQAQVPSLGEQAARAYHGRPYSMPWQALNERIIDLCRHFGAHPHFHSPDAGHLHDYSGQVRDGAL